MKIKEKNKRELVRVSPMPMHHVVKVCTFVSLNLHNLILYLECVELHLLQYKINIIKYEPAGQDSVSTFSQLFSSYPTPTSR
jgi:hypothetical protein